MAPARRAVLHSAGFCAASHGSYQASGSVVDYALYRAVCTMLVHGCCSPRARRTGTPNGQRKTVNGVSTTASVKFPFQTSNCLHTTIPYRWRAPRSRRPPRRESRAAEPVSSPQRSSSTDTQAGSCSSADGAVRMSALRGAPVTTHRSGPALCKARTWSSCHTTRAHRCVLSMLSTRALHGGHWPHISSFMGSLRLPTPRSS